MTTVLVVEDEPALAWALAITLKARNYDVVVARTGAAGLDAAATAHPDLVVLDLGLPDIDGMDVVAALRGWSKVPVLVLSARRSSGEKVAALNAGADDFVTRPFGMDELRAAVRRAPGEDAPAMVETRLVHRRRGAAAGGPRRRGGPPNPHRVEPAGGAGP